MIFTKLNLCALLIISVGCAQMQITSENFSRPKTINGETCVESPRLKILQVLEDGILAYMCPIDYPSYYDGPFEACMVKGDLVYMPVKPKENNYVDEQRVTLQNNQCFSEDGTFKYKSAAGVAKTVRKIKILVQADLQPNTDKSQTK